MPCMLNQGAIILSRQLPAFGPMPRTPDDGPYRWVAGGRILRKGRVMTWTPFVVVQSGWSILLWGLRSQAWAAQRALY